MEVAAGAPNQDIQPRRSRHMIRCGLFAGIALSFSVGSGNLAVATPLERGMSDIPTKPFSSCSPYATGAAEATPTKQRAAKCLKVHKGLDVALVVYDMPTEATKVIATTAAAEMNHATHGLIAPRIEVVPASEAATDLLHQQNPDGCIDHGNPSRYGAGLATVAMGLEEYDAVVGFTGLPACVDGVGGVSTEKGTEIFIAPNHKQNFGPKERDVAIKTIIHELLHSAGIGHDGILKSGSESLFPKDLNEHIEQSPDKTVDLAAYIAAGSYSEYEADNVMGKLRDTAAPYTLNPPQIHMIEWPQRELGQTTRVTTTDIRERAVVFSGAKDADYLAVLPLSEPLPMPRSTTELSDLSEYELFEKILFSPQFDDYEAWGTEVFLSGNRGSTVSLGLLWGSDEHYRLRLDNAIISVVMTGRTVSITAIEQ